MSIKSFLKSYPLLVTTKRYIWKTLRLYQNQGYSTIDIVESFPSFTPNSSGTYPDLSKLTIQTINNLFPAINRLIKSIDTSSISIEDMIDFPSGKREKESALNIKKVFDSFGSDKSTVHSYHWIYGSILSDNNSIKRIFEIGLGTNNIDIVSNMDVDGKPGASLRAFKKYCPKAEIHGADIDKRILFSENRIKTYYLDQTNPNSFDFLECNVPHDFDLFIDDGLHSPNANIDSLTFGLKIIRKGGWVIIEDIHYLSLPIWLAIAALLPRNNFKVRILKEETAILFAVQKQ